MCSNKNLQISIFNSIKRNIMTYSEEKKFEKKIHERNT